MDKSQHKALHQMQQVWHKLAVNLLAYDQLKAPWALGVASAVRGEGRTTSAIALSSAIARETGDQVALLEIDLEKPSLASEVYPGSTPGLLEYLSDECELEATFRSSASRRMTLVPGGSGWPQTPIYPTLDDVSIRLRRRMPYILDTLRFNFQYTVVDLPPVISSMYTKRLVNQLDGSLMILRSGITPLSLIQESLESLGEENVLGIVQLGKPSSVPTWLANLITG
ncbi:MAG: hypothetical protein WD208_10635 [Dehalococcoidia bacterium]